MRWLLLFCLTIVAATDARAQEQERKLVDRLMNPDMTLANSAQNKKFTAAEGTSVDKKFEARTFYSGDEHAAKPFGGVRDFFARTFGTKDFPRRDQTSSAVANAESAYAKTQFATKQSSLVRPSHDAGKSAATKDYADQRVFRGQGTRQKILGQQSRPMTIDEVRELLNRN